MHNIILHRKAEESLEYCRMYQKKDFALLMEALEQLENIGFQTSNIKDIGDAMRRKRVGRWRIVFEYYNQCFHVRIIAIEKDTKKDYQARKKYIMNSR